MKKEHIILILMGLIATHLLFSNTELLIKLMQINIEGEISIVSYTFAIIFALGYSLITAIIIKIYPKIILFVLIGILDSSGVYLFWSNIENEQFFTIASSIYFAIYTLLIIIISGLISKDIETNKTDKDETKTKLKQQNLATLYDNKNRIIKGLNSAKNPEIIEQKKTQLQKINKQILIHRENRNEKQ